MPDQPPPASPPASRLATPRWGDARLLGGLLLVLVAVVLGAKVVAEADDSVPVWAVTRDLAAGATLQAGDLVPRDLRYPAGADRYVGATGRPPEGYVLTRPVGAGEMLPAAAVAPPGGAAARRLVTVPAAPFHYPASLRRGERVDVYVTAEPTPGGPLPQPRLVLERVLVADVQERASTLGGAGGVGVVLSVAPRDVQAVVAAARAGGLDLVRVPAEER